MPPNELQPAPPVAKLPFPLDIDTLYTLNKGGFIIKGTATLASGTATVSDSRIKASSIPFLTYNTHSNQGVLKATIADGSLTIDSTDATDASDVFYLIFI